MTGTTRHPETFEAFKKSFFHGERSDLNFKFLSHLSDEDAGDFFNDLLHTIGKALDDGDFEQVTDHVLKWQIKGYAEQKNFDYEDGPFARLEKPASMSRIALLTSSGHFVQGDDPKPLGIDNMTQEDAEKKTMEFLKEAPQLSVIPKQTPKEKLVVRHGGYDVSAAKADANVVFPLELLLELEKEGTIGEVAQDAYSFVGACAQKRLLKKTGPEWVTLFQAKEIDAAILVPV